jgi:hypothetical protein
MAWRAGAQMRNAEGSFRPARRHPRQGAPIGAEDALYNAWHEKPRRPSAGVEADAWYDQRGVVPADEGRQWAAGTFHPEN